MKVAKTGIIAAAMLAVATVAFAQKPDFSGTWTIDTSAMPAPPAGGGGGGERGGGGRGMGGPMVVKQTADALTIERTMGGNAVTSAYKLDGTESVNKRTMGQMGEIEIKSVAKWDGNKLVLTHKQPAPDGSVRENTEIWTLEDGTLTIESTNARGTQKRVYKKTT